MPSHLHPTSPSSHISAPSLHLSASLIISLSPHPLYLCVFKWKPKGVIHAGDTLVFKWRGIPHDVWIMNTMDAYNACDFGAATRKTGITSVGKYKYKVPASAKGKSIFFSCSVPGHCSAFNMKVAVPIHA
ncbi:unnamed protein product [Closterium sp. NIES-54]